jgi:beta-lactamase superfamily II metal-dependent hydrolase
MKSKSIASRRRSGLVLPLLIGGIIALSGASRAFAPAKPGELTIYSIDADGGHSTLYVSPTGESLLYDTDSGRINDRILAALDEAGIKELDYVVLSHYDGDHVNGLPALAEKITIHNFVDHGPRVSSGGQNPNANGQPDFQKIYPSIYAKGKHIVVKPGDKLPLKGMEVLVLTSNGEAIQKPLAGAGKPNPECASFVESPDEPDENWYTAGLLFTVGKFRTVNFSDLLWNMEKKFMCPDNLVGTVDVYFTSHHGLDRSGSPALVHALHPRVAVATNSFSKGGQPKTFATLETSPGLEDVWSNHWAAEGGIEYNPPARFIANIESPELTAQTILHPPGRQFWGGHPPGVPAPNIQSIPGRLIAPTHSVAYMIKITAKPTGEFTVTNTRNGFSKTYPALDSRK